VFADYDGVVTIPFNQAAEVVKMATEKAIRENCSRKDLLSGSLLKDVYDKYGVL
jgi:4-hydroxy-4-methyl-2-oxoglutarate aldolase